MGEACPQLRQVSEPEPWRAAPQGRLHVGRRSGPNTRQRNGLTVRCGAILGHCYLGWSSVGVSLYGRCTCSWWLL